MAISNLSKPIKKKSKSKTKPILDVIPHAIHYVRAEVGINTEERVFQILM